jgi:hypothetical protein
MVTPTFAAGLGVVVAAGLAVSMSARTVLHFSGPDQGKPCTQRGCRETAGSGGPGTLASAKPGIRLMSPSPLGPAGPTEPSPSFTGGLGGEDSKHHAGRQVVVGYRTTSKFSWGFSGQIVISGMPASARATWRLGFHYPGTRIVEVQGAQWQPTGQDSGVAAAEGSDGGGQSGSGSNGGDPGGSGRDSSGNDGQQGDVVITIVASGTPSAPSGCRFDDTPCSFG